MAVIAGILAGNCLNVSDFIWLGIFFVSLLLFAVYRPLFDPRVSYHRRWIFGTIVSIGLFSSGAYQTQKGKYFDENISQSSLIVAMVNQPPKINPNSIKAELITIKYQRDKVWFDSGEKILVSFEKDSGASQLEYGDLLLLKGKLNEIKNPGNPSEFDYKKYLSRKHIHFGSYQNSEQWTLLEKNKGKILLTFAYSIRKKILNIYQSTGIKGEEFAILAALTLGTKDYLSDETIEAYSSSGAMHVLAVSGLHVGIIFFVINYLLFFLRKKPSLLIIRAVLLIAIIWSFALITGLSPSVNRASLMITFFIIGQASNKKPSAYNSIAASAFILLLIEPQTIFNVGFQLSYLAVISILFFQPKIYRWFEPRYYVLDKIWSLTSVSIAAQIGTTVLGLYYFHQFPVYAFLSNLVVIPAAFLIMVMAIAVASTFFIFPLSEFLAKILSGIIYGLNTSTKFIESLPGSTIKPLSLNSIETILLYFALTLFLIFIILKNKKLFGPILVSILIVLFFRDIRYARQTGSKSFAVYNVTKKSVFSIISDRQFKLYADSSFISDSKSVNYLTSNIMSDNFLRNLNKETIDFPRSKNLKVTKEEALRYLVQVDSLKILFLTGDLSRFRSTNKLKVNYLIFCKSTLMDLNVLKSLFDFDLLIADASVSKWKQETLKKDCRQLAIPFYNVSESGAFVKKIGN